MTDIATLQAHIAIGEVKARYCRCLDTKDWAGYAELFTEDFELPACATTSALRRRRARFRQIPRRSYQTPDAGLLRAGGYAAAAGGEHGGEGGARALKRARQGLME